YRSSVKIVVFPGDDLEYLATLPDHYFDWSYLDTDHGYEQTKLELELLNAKTKADGLIAGHDWNYDCEDGHHGVYRALTEFCKHSDWRVVLLDKHTQWAIQRC